MAFSAPPAIVRHLSQGIGKSDVPDLNLPVASTLKAIPINERRAPHRPTSRETGGAARAERRVEYQVWTGPERRSGVDRRQYIRRERDRRAAAL
jgi:hypothetical protein